MQNPINHERERAQIFGQCQRQVRKLVPVFHISKNDALSDPPGKSIRVHR